MACKYLFEGKWYTEEGLREVYNQRGGEILAPSKASSGTLKKIKEFLDRIGVETQTLAKIEYNGRALGVNGLADPLNGLIQVVQGKEDTVLPEEAMHMAVELIEQKNPTLFKQMMDRIGRYNLFDQVMAQYQNNPFYQTKEGRPDVRKIKKETIGKVLAQTVINKNEEANEKPELLVQTASWWQKIIDFLKWLFGKAQFNPFETAATQVLSGELQGTVGGGGGLFASRNQNVVNASLKLVASLRDPRAEKWFKSLDRETFLKKLQSDLQAPKAQVDMLKGWLRDNNPATVGDMIAGVLSELSYTIEMNVSRGAAIAGIANMTVEEFENMPEEMFRREVENDFLDEYHLAKEHDGKIYYIRVVDGSREDRVHVVDSEEGSPSSHYSNLTVPGGTNYRENEIKTPDITPAIKGHAQFATDQGIGWFRSDDNFSEKGRVRIRMRDDIEIRPEIEKFIDRKTNKEKWKVSYVTEDGVMNIEVFDSEEEANSLMQKVTKDVDIDQTKIRRILEIQSDLFQKSRDSWNLVGSGRVAPGFRTIENRFTIGDRVIAPDKKEYEVVEYYPSSEGAYLPDENQYEPDHPEAVRLRGPEGEIISVWGDNVDQLLKLSGSPSLTKNDFLQLLNKDNHWVTFFVKAIIQDSAKKGYEKVRFPGGSTANKIEGQQTLEEFISSKEDRITLLNDELSAIDQYAREMSGEFDASLLMELRQRKSRAEDEIMQLEKEIQDAKEGKAKFAAIANFYETTVHNILKKQGYNPQAITDEHGNKWFEIDIKPNRDLGEFYFQVSGPQDLAEKISQRDVNLTKRGDEYEINGNRIKNTVQKEVLDFYKKRIGAARAEKLFKGFKQETESKVQVDIKDILNRYIDQDGRIRVEPLKQTNPSAVDPNDSTFYMTLENHIKQRLDSYEPGTTFFHSVNLYDGLRTAGTADLITITPQGKVDILQFKVPQLARGAVDVPVYRQEAYNIEIEALRKILQTGYGVRRGDFRQTRAIPIKAEYETLPGTSDVKLSKLTVGNTNVELIEDDTLLPISSESEKTGDERFDEYITRLRGLAQKLASEKVPPEQRNERSQRIAGLIAAIRKLQIKKDASGIIASAKAIIKNQKEKGKILKDKISNTDPDVATIEELNKMAADIMDAKDQVEIYVDMYSIFKNTFNDGTADSKDTIEEARYISDDARDIVDDYWQVAVDFRTKKFAAKVGIKDEFTPEKKLTWYRRMIRSLSQSSIKAGAELWELVKRINNRFKLDFLDRLSELSKIESEVSEWMKGKTIQDLYKKIFQYDSQGRWNGRVIQKIDRSFYEELKKAQGSRDMKWVKDNIDTEAYMEWFKTEHARRLEDAKTARIHADDAENNRLIQQGLQEFVDTFHIDFKKGVGTNNWALKNFPKEENWKSQAYQELERPENAPVLALYNYWIERLEESWREGMLHEHNGWSWFPNVRRNLLEKFSTAPAKGKLSSLFGSIRIEAEDQVFGRIDPLTGKPIDEVHANFVSDLGEWVQDADGNYFLDYSEKSMDIFKVLALWDAEIIKYKLRVESEDIARLIHYTEEQRKAFDSTSTGKLKRNAEGKPIQISNEVNAKYVKDHIDAVYYGKRLDDEADVAINLPYKAAVEKINKLFGREILSVPEQNDIRMSGKKAIQTMNRYFVTKTLGLNIMTSVAQLFGGTVNAFINQGVYFNKKDLLEAEMKYIAGRMYATDQDKKLAGLIGYVHPFVEDRTSQEIRKLSVSGLVNYFSSDHLFYLQRGADSWVNSIIGMAVLKNTMVHEGKLVNIRQFAKKELGHANKYEGTYREAKEFDARLEKRVTELQNSPQALVNYVQIVNDQIVIPGIGRDSQELVNLRQQILEIIKDALGNTSQEDLSLYKRSIMWQSFFMFKNWIPRMFDVRYGSLKYSPGTDKYEYGRMRMLGNAVRQFGLSSIQNLMKLLGNNSEPLIEVAKKEYVKKREAFAEELQDLEMTEAEFVDMYIKGVRSGLKEVLLAIGLISLYVTMRAQAPDGDESPEYKGAYRWALRGLDKLTDELSFMYNPKSFTNILNGSVFPAVGLLVEAQKLVGSAFMEALYLTLGDQEAADQNKVAKHLFRALPITKEALQYLALFNNDIAREYGIKINNQYGSIR